jgi:serine/threonine-protein kinase
MSTDEGASDASPTAARFAALEQLFDSAVHASPQRRAAILSEIELRDPPLSRELRALLAAHESDRSLGALALEAITPRDEADALMLRDAEREGLHLGAWAIGRRIGAGGMGTVHEAVRADDQYQQRVAVKFLRRITDSDDAARRFRSERQILASLQHPRIAALLDGGVTPDGQPYFVMEYIDGSPITTWCDARKLDVEARLRIFLDVCDAVRAAHRRLVVHRDLKPSNILVREDGAVKLVDFGIAKLLDDDNTESQHTAFGARAFTPEYAAPEQMRGEPVSTTADVYALGVLLYELLTGRRPFSLAGLSASAMERVVTETPTPRPSAELAEAHSVLLGERSLERARRSLAGDLDAIVGMALRKEPDRRYASVNELMDDITRHLAGRPVIARPDSAGYRMGKFVRRRRVELFAASVAVLSLVAGTAAAMRQASRASSEAARATEVQAFLTEMLGAAKPGVLGADARVRDVLDSAAYRLNDARLSPALEAELRNIIGDTYLALGEYTAADTQYVRSLYARERADGRSTLGFATAMVDVGIARWEEGNYESADSVLRLADSLQRVLRDVPPLARSTLLDTRAQTLNRLGNNADALPLLYESLDLHRAHFPDDAVAAVPTFVSAAVVASDLGNHLVGDSLLASALALQRRVAPNDEAALAMILTVRAGVLERLGEMDSAEAAFREVIGIRERVLGPEHPNLAMTMLNLGDHLRRRGRYAESTQWTRRVVALRGRTLDDTNVALPASMMHLGMALARLDSADVGERWLREAYRLRAASLPKGHWMLASTNSSLAEVLTAAGRYAEAEALLIPAERQLSTDLPHSVEPVQDVWRRLRELYTAWGKPSEAAKWEARAKQATNG